MKIEGTVVKDADDHLTITVTKNDVRLGSAKKARSCAAAQAICRQTGATEARVHVSRAYIKKDGKWLRFATPPSMRNEIIAFDRGGIFAPGEYTLVPVQPTVRLDAPSRTYNRPADNRVGAHKSKGKLKKKRPYHVVSGVRKQMVADWE